MLYLPPAKRGGLCEVWTFLLRINRDGMEVLERSVHMEMMIMMMVIRLNWEQRCFANKLHIMNGCGFIWRIGGFIVVALLFAAIVVVVVVLLKYPISNR